MVKVLHIPLDQIEVVRNVRQDDGERYHELVQSMKSQGQLVPVQVYQHNGSYALQFGHQRLKAAHELGWGTILATEVLPPYCEEGQIIQRAMENQARSDLSYLEQAQVYQDLKDLGLTQQEIADRFGVHKSVISIALATLRADPKIQRAIEEGKLSPSAAEALVFQDLETQAKLADAAIAAKTQRKVAALVQTQQKIEETLGDLPLEETEFEDDPMLKLYRGQVAGASTDRARPRQEGRHNRGRRPDAPVPRRSADHSRPG